MAGFKRTISRISEALAERRESGATTEELATEIGRHINHVGGALGQMGKAGTVAWHMIGSAMVHNKRRWYLPEHKPAEAPPLPQPTVCFSKPKLKRLNCAQAARGAMPAPVQCPTFDDTRFTFRPPPGWVGEITRDWQKRRLKEAQA